MKIKPAFSRFFVSASLSLASLCLVGVTSAAQGAKEATWKVPRTEHGYPDLQGNWTNATITPVERPAKFGDRRALSKEEAHELHQATAEFNEENAKPTDPSKGVEDLPEFCQPGWSRTNCGYNYFWMDSGTQVVSVNGELRSSIIVSPANGRIPALTPQARDRFAAAARAGNGAADGPEARSVGERCLLAFGSSAGPPMLPSMYNNNYQIVQSKDRVMILVEMVHDVRVIRIGGEHLPSNVRLWMGDSIGHYEGDTLVVETTNFHLQQSYRGASENLKVTERFTRVTPNQVVYQFTMEDPTTFTQPFSGELNMKATRDSIYEYACHEGNYALVGILAGARAEEAAKAKRATDN
jgi:hypothetical protein